MVDPAKRQIYLLASENKYALDTLTGANLDYNSAGKAVSYPREELEELLEEQLGSLPHAPHFPLALHSSSISLVAQHHVPSLPILPQMFHDHLLEEQTKDGGEEEETVVMLEKGMALVSNKAKTKLETKKFTGAIQLMRALDVMMPTFLMLRAPQLAGLNPEHGVGGFPLKFILDYSGFKASISDQYQTLRSSYPTVQPTEVLDAVVASLTRFLTRHPRTGCPLVCFEVEGKELNAIKAKHFANGGGGGGGGGGGEDRGGKGKNKKQDDDGGPPPPGGQGVQGKRGYINGLKGSKNANLCLSFATSHDGKCTKEGCTFSHAAPDEACTMAGEHGAFANCNNPKCSCWKYIKKHFPESSGEKKK